MTTTRFIFLILAFVISTVILSGQTSGTYKLTVKERPAFGELSPTGEYTLSLFNSSGIEEFKLDFSPIEGSDGSRISYHLITKYPFVTISKQFQDLYELDLDGDYLNNRIDSLFNSAISIITKFQNPRLNADFEKRTLPSQINIRFRNDTIVDSYIANCDWRLDTSFEPYRWRLRSKPTRVMSFSVIDNVIKTAQIIECQDRQYIRHEHIWDEDSTYLTIRTYNSNNALVRKSVEKYLNNRQIANYSIDFQTGDTIKRFEVSFPNKNERSTVYFSNNKPVQKSHTKENDNNDIIEVLNYEIDPFDNKMVLQEKKTIKYEYDQNNKKTSVLLLDQSNKVVEGAKIYYGLIY